MNRKTIGTLILTLCMLFMLGTTSALAADYDVTTGGPVILSGNGTHTITGVSSLNTVTVTGGTHIIEIVDLEIDAAGLDAPAINIIAGEVTLIIEGENVLVGGKNAEGLGRAGIRVAVGAELIISEDSTGKLTVTGGQGAAADKYEHGGAGIGSNAQKNSFGTIIINGGTIEAQGGLQQSTKTIANSGAGIGTGALHADGSLDWDMSFAEGTIEIYNGTVTATGGKGENKELCGGGAGIGSGAYNQTVAYNNIEINIYGGIVKAVGGNDAAGIGGGNSAPSGFISIYGGDIEAYGGEEAAGGSFGGAGIGGGDTGGFTTGITITGDSRVLAVGGGAAAGIGGGNNEGNWAGYGGENYSITISGNAYVKAIGGKAGGAGIGSGRFRYSTQSMGGIINILENAEVEAYGGTGANAIGNGLLYIPIPNEPYDPVKITIDSSVSLKAFTSYSAALSTIAAICDDEVDSITINGDAILHTYTGEAVTINTDANTTTPLGLTWEWGDTGDELTLVIDSDKSFTADKEYLGGNMYNWAILEPVVVLSEFHLTYDVNGGTGTAPVDDDSLYAEGSTTTVLPPSGLSKEGYTFAGWNTKAEGDGDTYQPGDTITIDENITLYAIWVPLSTGLEYFKLVFDTNGGSHVASITVVAGTTIILNQTTTREGYTFLGWYSDSDLTNKISSIVMNQDEIVYAKWEKIKTQPSVFAYGEKAKTQPPVLERDDHIAYIKGYPDGSVGPERYLTRAETIMIFFRLIEGTEKNISVQSSFSDVKPDAWYAQAVAYLENNNILKGYPDNTYRPEQYITRAELITVMTKFGGLHNGTNIFNDLTPAHWAFTEIISAASKKWIEGYPDGSFGADNYISRAEAVTSINRMLNRKIELFDLPKDLPQYTDLPSSHWAYCALMEATFVHEYERKTNDYERWINVN